MVHTHTHTKPPKSVCTDVTKLADDIISPERNMAFPNRNTYWYDVYILDVLLDESIKERGRVSLLKGKIQANIQALF